MEPLLESMVVVNSDLRLYLSGRSCRGAGLSGVPREFFAIIVFLLSCLTTRVLGVVDIFQQVPPCRANVANHRQAQTENPPRRLGNCRLV